MTIEFNNEHKGARLTPNFSIRNKIVIPFFTGVIAVSLFSGCKNQDFVNNVPENGEDYSNSQMGDYNADDQKYSQKEYLGSTHKIVDGDQNITVSGYIGNEIAEYKNVDYVRNGELTTTDFKDLTDLTVDTIEDLSWLKYCDNLEYLFIREGHCRPEGLEDVQPSPKDTIAEAPNLTSLHVSASTFTSDEYEVVKGLDNLSELAILCDYVDPGFVEGLTQLDRLRIESNRIILDCSKLTFLNSLEFASAYGAAINMSLEDYANLTRVGVDISIRGLPSWEEEQTDYDRFFEFSKYIDDSASTFTFDENTSDEEKVNAIIATALAEASGESEFSRQSTYYLIAAGLSNRFGVRLTEEQLDVTNYADEMAEILGEQAEPEVTETATMGR